MKADHYSSAAADERLDAVVAEYLESVERGESSAPEVWLRRYPEVATELELFFAAETRFDRLVAPLRMAAVGPATPSVAAAPVVQPLKTIKDYDLLAEIGRGGMGVIYKARQRSLNRLVAIKMIRSAEWATPAERMRFHWEAEAIASLDHPNIVPIYEIGEAISDDGTQLPFFSMKLIEGDNLAQGRELFRNNWKAIARLMVIVGRAVEHAHQRGILHRDLKPANILLGSPSETGTPWPTGLSAPQTLTCPQSGAGIPAGDSPAESTSPQRGAGIPACHAPSSADHISGSNLFIESLSLTPHISDFGLAARAQQQRGQTYLGTIVGTPSYLAPELASGKATATIASDVYALGAILYELLTGEPPFRGETPLETIRLLTTSKVQAPRKGDSAIPLDLETICLKCLQPDPQQRYRSAGKLADDLELFLAGRSISARPVGTLEALRRWRRRQPVIAGLSAALLLSVAVSLPLILWNWHRAVEHELLAEKRLEETRLERERADGGFELAHSAFEDLFRMIGDSRTEEFSESDATNKELLERGLKYYREFVDRRRDDPKLRREMAAAMLRIGMISGRIKTKREAVEAYDKAIDFLQSLLDQYPQDAPLLEMQSRALSNRGNALAQLDRFDEAIRCHDAAAEIWSRLSGEGADLPNARREQGIALMNRGVTFRLKGDWPAVLDSFRQAKEILENCGAPERVHGPLVDCLLSLSQAESELNDHERAARHVREAKLIAESRFKQFPNSEETRLMMAQSLHAAAKMETRAGNPTAAKTALVAALQILEALHRAKPRRIQYKRSLAYSFGELATVERQQKNPAEALRALESAERHLREILASDADARVDRGALASIAYRLGEAYLETKNYAAAAKAYEQSRNQTRILIGGRPSGAGLRLDLARACFFLSRSYHGMRKETEALAATEEAIESYRIVLQQDSANKRAHKTLSSALGNKALILRALSRPADAITATEERMKLWPASANELYDAAIDFTRTFDFLHAKAESDPELQSRAVKSAIKALQQALGAGLPSLDGVRNDPVFMKIKQTEGFQKFLNETGRDGH